MRFVKSPRASMRSNVTHRSWARVVTQVPTGWESRPSASITET